VGSSFVVALQGPPGDDVFLMVSSGQGPTTTPFGTFCLDFPAKITFHLTLPGSGQVSFTRQMPCDSRLVGATGYLQFLGIDRNTNVFGISNQSSLTIIDGPCDDRFCTYTQGGWGAGCSGNNIACLREPSSPTSSRWGSSWATRTGSMPTGCSRWCSRARRRSRTSCRRWNVGDVRLGPHRSHGDQRGRLRRTAGRRQAQRGLRRRGPLRRPQERKPHSPRRYRVQLLRGLRPGRADRTAGDRHRRSRHLRRVRIVRGWGPSL
jgi:hypothetical protein